MQILAPPGFGVSGLVFRSRVPGTRRVQHMLQRLLGRTRADMSR